MRHGSLCSGIGGFDLAASWMGWSNVFQCEIDPFCLDILAKHYPSTIRHHDIKELDGRQYKGKVDVITAGFPCQPWSIAGKRKGAADERHLWPEVARIVREAKPTYCVCENVHGLCTQDGGSMLDEVCGDLEAEGYEVWPLLFPSSACHARMRRDRVWILANLAGDGRQDDEPARVHEGTLRDGVEGSNVVVPMPPTPTPPFCELCGTSDVLSRKLQSARIKALGNSINPYCALALFQGIQEHASVYPEAPRCPRCREDIDEDIVLEGGKAKTYWACTECDWRTPDEEQKQEEERKARSLATFLDIQDIIKRVSL